MGVLRNYRREQGALALYAGKSDKEAMEAAGYVYSPANGRRFRNSPDIRARLRELFEADRPFVVLDALRARRERQAIAHARMSAYFVDAVDAEGKLTGELQFKGFAALTDQEVAAIASIKQGKNGVELKLHDKDASLRAIEARVDPVVAQGREPDHPSEPAPSFDATDEWGDLTQQVRPN